MTDDTEKTSRIKAVVAKLASAKESSEPAPPWVSYVAMLTGVLAAVAGFLTVRATTLTNNAIYESNQAILAQAQSSDDWAEFQSDSIKARIIETQMDVAGAGLDPKIRATLEDEDKDFRDRQPKQQAAAQAKAAERDDHLSHGKDYLATRDLISYANLATELGIALASVAAMVRVRRAFEGALLVGGVGIGIAAYALLRQYLAGIRRPRRPPLWHARRPRGCAAAPGVAHKAARHRLRAPEIPQAASRFGPNRACSRG